MSLISQKKFVVPLTLDLAKLDEAQQKADKLKATLLEIQELVQKASIPTDIFTSVEKSVEEFLKNRNERREEFKKRLEQKAFRIKKW